MEHTKSYFSAADCIVSPLLFHDHVYTVYDHIYSTIACVDKACTELWFEVYKTEPKEDFRSVSSVLTLFFLAKCEIYRLFVIEGNFSVVSVKDDLLILLALLCADAIIIHIFFKKLFPTLRQTNKNNNNKIFSLISKVRISKAAIFLYVSFFGSVSLSRLNSICMQEHLLKDFHPHRLYIEFGI